MTRFFPLRHIHNRQSRCKPRTGPKKVFPAGGCLFLLSTPQWRSHWLSDALRGHSSWARFVIGGFGGAIRGAFGRIRLNRSVSGSNPRFRWRSILADVWCHPAPLNVQINRMRIFAFAPNNNYSLSDSGPPGVGLERNRSCQTRHDAGRPAINRSGCSPQACRTPHAASVLPLRACYGACYGGGVFHAEAGDSRGRSVTRPSLR